MLGYFGIENGMLFGKFLPSGCLEWASRAGYAKLYFCTVTLTFHDYYQLRTGTPLPAR